MFAVFIITALIPAFAGGWCFIAQYRHSRRSARNAQTLRRLQAVTTFRKLAM